MNIPVNFIMWFMAFLPIITLIVLMVKFHWGATEAAPVGLVITVITALVFYKADLSLIAEESAKGVWNAIVIILIVWTAILMYQVGDQAKAFLVIRDGMSKLLPNELVLVIAMGWIFESFLQGITGFGVPVAVGAPLLIGIGVKPMYAVVIPLLGQAWGNTFGTLAAAWDSLSLSTGMQAGSAEYFKTAFWAALFLLMWNIVTGVVICWLYGKGKAVKKGFPIIIVMAIIQGGGELILSQVNTTLCCFIPSVISLMVLMLMGRTKMYRDEWRIEDSPIMKKNVIGEKNEVAPADMSLVQAFVPYIVLSVLTIVVLTITPINEVLNKVSIGLSFPETTTGYGYVNAASASYSPIHPLTHASMFLFISAIIGLVYYKAHGWIKAGGTKKLFINSVTMTLPSGIALVGLIIMSRIMGGTGQTVVLADGISSVLGIGYVILAPFIGLLGTFMTGSNMSSNILFGEFQMTTAKLLHVSIPAVLGAQTAGGAIGAAISPSKIILGTTTANILGEEGEIMKIVMMITVPATLLIGAFLFIMCIV